MKKLIIPLMLIATAFLSCRKDCDKNHTAIIKVVNTTNSNYDITVNGETKGVIKGKGGKTLIVNSGENKIVAIEADDTNPRVTSKTITVFFCEGATFTIK